MGSDSVGMVLSLLAGIALFIFSMNMIEDSVKGFAGRSFKLFLKRITGNVWATVAGSVIVTGILQGSSVMMAMLMSFTGAGILPLSSAIAVILGANLGTTLDSWIVASVGFRMNLDMVANPAIILAALLLILSPGRFKYHSRFLLGLGLLLLSVSIMKQSVSGALSSLPMELAFNRPLWIFVFIGIAMTAILQSSLATMTLALSALHSGALALDFAIALVIGSEVGTTLKLFLGAIDGFSPKKRLALANLLINVVTALLAFFLMDVITGLIQGTLLISDPLLILVSFQSVSNLLSVVLFLPFVSQLAQLLGRWIKENDKKLTAYIKSGEVGDVELSAELFLKEAFNFIASVMAFNLKTMGLETTRLQKDEEYASIEERRGLTRLIPAQHYDALKIIHGELQLYYIKLRSEGHSSLRSHQLEHATAAVRHAMHAAKGLNDISKNISNLTRSSNFIKFDVYRHASTDMLSFYGELEAIVTGSQKAGLERMITLHEEINRQYAAVLEHTYEQTSAAAISNTDFTTMMNFSRELFSSNRSMLMAVASLALDAGETDQFNERVLYAA